MRIADYDPAWPVRFCAERALLGRLLAPWTTGGIHHVGSTAVAGLAAKPVIDILVGVAGLEESRDALDPLAALEYHYQPYRAQEMHWLCKPHPARRTHHLHLVPTGRFQEELELRDRLRSDPGLAAAYAHLKHELAGRLTHDNEAYTNAKADFIRSSRGRRL